MHHQKMGVQRAQREQEEDGVGAVMGPLGTEEAGRRRAPLTARGTTEARPFLVTASFQAGQEQVQEVSDAAAGLARVSAVSTSLLHC